MESNEKDFTQPNTEINTDGGSVNEGSVDTGGGNFAGRDQYIYYTGESEQAEFVKIELNRNRKSPIKADIMQKLMSVLQSKHLLVIGKHPHISQQSLAFYLAYEMYRSDTIESIFEWSGDIGQLDFSSMISGKEDQQMADPGLYLCSDFTPPLLSNISHYDISSILQERQQYMILTVNALIEEDKASSFLNTYWGSIDENIYTRTYLTDELHQTLKMAKKLPDPIPLSATPGQLIPELSLEDVATQLRSPTNISVFVAHLENQSEKLDKKGTLDLIETTVKQDINQKIRYLFEQLPDRQAQLLAAGLCLFGELYKAQFFYAVKQAVCGAWQYMFESTVLFDYYHLEPLRSLLHHQEGLIKHRHPNQRRPLFEVAWEKYEHHIREALPILVDLAEHSTAQDISQYEDFEDYAKRNHLRTTVSHILADLSQLSVYVVEDTLLRFATHDEWGLQTTAARAIAEWGTYGEAEQDKLLDLLTRWQQGKWRRESQDPLNPGNIQMTVARSAYYKLITIPFEKLPSQLTELLWGLMVSPHENARNYFYDSIHKRLFPRYLTECIEDWKGRFLDLPDTLESTAWLVALVRFGRVCSDEGRLEEIESWWISEFLRLSDQEPDLLAVALCDEDNTTLSDKDKEWLFDKVFSSYFDQLHKLLLQLHQSGRCHSKIVSVFEQVRQAQPQQVQDLLDNWYQQWRQCLESQDENQIAQWLRILSSVGTIYHKSSRFDDFEPWLTTWLTQRQTEQHYRIVPILVEIHQQQSVDQMHDEPPVTEDEQAEEEDARREKTLTDVENLLYGWLARKPPDAPELRIALLFESELVHHDIAQQCAEQMAYSPTWIDMMLSYGLGQSPRRRRVIVQNLLPLARTILQIHPEAIDLALAEWKKAPLQAVNQMAESLQKTLRLSAWLN